MLIKTSHFNKYIKRHINLNKIFSTETIIKIKSYGNTWKDMCLTTIFILKNAEKINFI